MLIKVLSFIKGSVFFSAEGGFFERFLNLCSLQNINLKNVKNDGVKLTAFTSADDYKRIRTAAKNSGMKVKIIKKSGLPFFLKHNKIRVGAIFGIVIASAALILASLCVWNTEIVGNKAVKEKDLTKILEKCNIKSGSFKSKINTEETEKTLTENFPQILWVSVNIYGSKVRVEIREKDQSPEIEDYSEPSNLVASKDGRIILVKGFTGTNKVKEGDVVVKGDILISGVNMNGDNTETLVKSTGEVIAQTQTKFKTECIKNKNINAVSGVDDSITFEFFGLKLHGVKAKEKHGLYGKNTECLKGNKEDLPVKINWSCFFDITKKEITLTDNRALLCALTKCVEEYREYCKNAEISSIKFKKHQNNKYVSIDLSVSGTENIAKETKIIIDG